VGGRYIYVSMATDCIVKIYDTDGNLLTTFGSYVDVKYVKYTDATGADLSHQAFPTPRYQFGAGATYLEFVKGNPTNQLEPLWSIGVPESLVNGGGYGMTRYGMRKEDCSLRVAYTGALAEMRANGAISAILKKYGLTDRNLSMYKMSF